MKAQAVPCRIDGIVAAKANLAVIFRRGPSRCCQMLLWDLDTDVVTPGQWIRARVYTRRCDISPDGRYVVVMASSWSAHHRERFGNGGGWTALSRPPYFTAVGVWPGSGTWFGGGRFKDDHVLLLNQAGKVILAPPPDIKIKNSLSEMHEHRLFADRLEHRGWTRINPDPVWWKLTHLFKRNEVVCLEKEVPGGKARLELSENRERWSLIDSSGAMRKVWQPSEWHPQWVDVDRRGRVVFGEDGCLWAWADFPAGEPSMVADLNRNRFEQLEAPEWAQPVEVA